MDIDTDKIDEMTLALMHLVMFGDKVGTRAWKGFDWDTLARLHEKGYIANPRGKAKSVWMTDEGARRAEELFHKHFALPGPPAGV